MAGGETGRGVAILAGEGALPRLLAQAAPEVLICQVEGFPDVSPGAPVLRYRIERFVPFFEELAARGITRVCLAGAMQRPRLDPALFDPRTAGFVPRLLGALQAGDDSTLRAVVGLVEEFGFTVIGAQVLAPELVPGEGLLCGTPSAQDEADASRAAQIVAALGAADVGQGAVVARGLCLGVEALPGTDAMLEFVARHRALVAQPRAGVLFKGPKPGQDHRVDLPALGPQTVAGAAAAGLAGIAFAAGGVLLLDRAATVQAAQEAGIALWGRAR